MATEISNGRQTVKLYRSVNRGKAMYQLAYYLGGRRVQRNFVDKAEAKRVAWQILGGLTSDAQAVEAMGTPELDQWIGGLKLGATTKNDMRRVLETCGNWAEKQGHLLKGYSPFPGMMRYKETKSDVSIFTPENIASLLKRAEATLRAYLALGAFAGLRTAEIQRLDWSEIDLDRGYITVAASKAKTRQRRLVPIMENLKLWLLPIRKTAGPVCLHVSCQHAVKTKCVGLAWPRNGLRHSFISYRLAILHDTARVALEAGNSPQVIFSHYRELVTPEAAKEWFEVRPD